ncbi:MAG: imidazole glycerol phosphate synthase subunit HisH, partial [Dongiaceae bacterium]
VRPVLTLDAATVASAERVILMGVGAAPPAMAKLQAYGLVDCLRGLQQPVLGICVGMQLLFERSAEGEVACLGILPGSVEALPNSRDLPVPHMGWNQVVLLQPDNPLLDGLKTGDWAFYANSFYAPPSNSCIARTDYGVPISAVVNRGNVYGCQFHPEKSRRTGRRLLENFLRLR